MANKTGVLTIAAIAAAVVGVQSAMAAPCDADVTGDGAIDVLDLIEVLSNWGPCPGCDADITGDDVVDVLDLLEVLSNWGTDCGGVIATELAGKAVSGYPHFHYALTFNKKSDVQVAIDPSEYPAIIGQTGDIYIVESKTITGWLSDPSLTDETGGYQTETFVGGSIQDNLFTVSGSSTLDYSAGLGIGHPYDVVFDMNQSGALDVGDYIDGYDDDLPGFYYVHDLSVGGPLAVTEATYVCPNWDGTTNYGGQNTFYPTNIGSMGELPVVIIGHGNGHQYIWYDHIGNHLASYGFVVMSHRNNTGPGPNAAALTTFEHTERFIRELPNIEGGVLDGHIDTNKIIWVGHSRGGEGVAYAYDNIFDGTWTPTYFSIDDLQLVTSISPTDFYGFYETTPHDANFHLMYGAADSDVQGAPGGGSKPFSIYERGYGEKTVCYLQGCGHAWFHNGGGSSWASGPDLIGQSATHKTELGYFLALAKHYSEGSVPARDFLQRMYGDIHPWGIPANVIVIREFKHADTVDRFILDDYQTETSTSTSSSGGTVTYSVSNVAEAQMIDTDGSFATGPAFNGMTRSKNTLDKPRCVVFDWPNSGTRYYELNVVVGERDFSDDAYLSFRACQGTRHAYTDALDAPLTFTATLRDGGGTTSSIDFANYGGITRTYQRTGYGSGAGWANEFNTVRIRLTDFTIDGSGLDLTDIVAVRFEFGGGFGSNQGRIGLDDVELTKE